MQNSVLCIVCTNIIRVTKHRKRGMKTFYFQKVKEKTAAARDAV